MLRFAAIQTDQSIRLGYWMDWNDPDTLRMLAVKLMEDPMQQVTLQGPDGPYTNTVEQVIGHLGLPELAGSYFTFSNENNYMIWSFLKKCWERGWLYLNWTWVVRGWMDKLVGDTLERLLDDIHAPVVFGFDRRVGILQDVPDVSTEVQYPFLAPHRLAYLHREIGELSHLARDKCLRHSRALFEHGNDRVHALR